MKPTPTLQRLTLAALLLSAGALSLAPAAQADPGWRRWKQVDRGSWSRPVQRVVYRDRGHDGGGPALAGLIGGILIGTAIANAHPVVVHERVFAPPPPRYRYEDMYSDRWWDTLDDCRHAACEYRGPRVIRVVEISSGDCVRTLYWRHDHWISDDDNGDWND